MICSITSSGLEMPPDQKASQMRSTCAANLTGEHGRSDTLKAMSKRCGQTQGSIRVARRERFCKRGEADDHTRNANFC